MDDCTIIAVKATTVIATALLTMATIYMVAELVLAI